MVNLIKAGRSMFAIGMAFLGLLCIVYKDFILGRPPAWPANFPVNPALAYLSAAILIICALAILFKKQGGNAALSVGALIIVLSLFRHLPRFDKDWVNAYKTMALIGGALIISASFLDEKQTANSLNKVRERRIWLLLRIGYIFLAIFFLASGYAHFKFADFVKDFIPFYIPFRAFWAYFCGICLIAGGIGLLVPQTRTWAALLGAIMILGWFLLLHIPRILANPEDPNDRMGLCESFAFSGVLFVLAGMIRKMKE